MEDRMKQIDAVTNLEVRMGGRVGQGPRPLVAHVESENYTGVRYKLFTNEGEDWFFFQVWTKGTPLHPDRCGWHAPDMFKWHPDGSFSPSLGTSDSCRFLENPELKKDKDFVHRKMAEFVKELTFHKVAYELGKIQ